MTQTADRTRPGTSRLRDDRLPEWGVSYAEAIVDLDAIRHNTVVLKAASPGALMAVVKANAFGHGAVEVARAALTSGAAWLGVTSVGEARQLREGGIDAPVLAWMHLPTDDLGVAVRDDIDLSASSAEHLEAIAAAGRDHGARVQVHLKVDSGLHRNGADPTTWVDLVRRASQLERQGSLRVRGLWSHLARADEPGSVVTMRQLRVFDEAVAAAREAGLSPDVLHVASSAALLASPETHYTLARAGIALYGVEPIAGRTHGLRPAMTLRARTIMARTVPAGTAVSYGHEYVTERQTSLALVPMGFADGIPRAAGGRAEVLVGGVRAGVAGRVAMDQFVVDSGDHPVAIGEEVLIFGPGDAGEPTVEDWARWVGTNPHEILTGIGSRVTRRHLSAGSTAPRVRVAVVFGGRSGEHEVSCASGSAIVVALDPRRYDVVPVLIPRDGDPWTGMVDVMRTLRDVDVVVPALHGPQGEDGTFQGLLATLGVPFVGSGVLASAVGMDKAVAKQVFAAAGLAVADGVVLRDGETTICTEDQRRLGLPVFVKPARAGSSQGVTKVCDWGDLGQAIETARAFDPKVLVESALAGREIDVAVIEHPDGRLEAGPPLEVHYGIEQDHFSYAAKYADSSTVFDVPASLDAGVTGRLQRLALDVFELLGCSGLLRVDLFWDDQAQRAVVNEVNTFPGFTEASQFPRIWAASGLSYPDLVDTLVQTALSERRVATR